MVDVETGKALAEVSMHAFCRRDQERSGFYIHVDQGEQAHQRVELDGANDIPLFLIYNSLVPKSPPCKSDCRDTPGPPISMLVLRAVVDTYCEIRSTSTVLRSKSS